MDRTAHGGAADATCADGVAKAIDSLAAEEAGAVARRRAEVSALRRDLEEIPALLRSALAEWRAELLVELRKYGPDEPRVPRGNRHGGEWTKGAVDAAPSASINGPNVPLGHRTSIPPRQYAEQDTGIRTDATAADETVSRGSNGLGGAVSDAPNWLQTGAENAWSDIQDAIGAAAEAEIETQQVRAQFGLEHPGLLYGTLAGGAAVAIALATLPELVVAGGPLEGVSVEEVPALARGGVYAPRNVEGTIMRTGRTGDLARRAAEHARDPLLEDLSFDPIYRTDVYAERRGLEQILHDAHQPPLNRINPIDPENPNFDEYMKAAKDYLTRAHQ